jgi:hypothetical protein
MEVSDGRHVTKSPLAHLTECICLALKRSHAAPLAITDLDGALLALSSLELATDEYVLARSRLLKARRYLQCGERGAAEFEMSMALRSLKVCFD